MTSKKIWLGILVMVFGMAVVGCNEDDSTNGSDIDGMMVSSAKNETLHIPFEFMGILNTLEVFYKANDSVSESGFDALDLPFDPNSSIGYPFIHARIKDMKNTGYRRFCGWIQLVHREYFSNESLEEPDQIELSVDTLDPNIIYGGFGYPAELIDIPCNNLRGNVKGKWTAYTYLIEMPTRMNGIKIKFLAGFRWGYFEALEDNKLVVDMQEIKEINDAQWQEHIEFLREEFPQYEYE